MTELELNTVPQSAQPTSSSKNSSLSSLAIAGAGALALGALASRPALAVTPPLRFGPNIPGSGDIKVLNFALSLEDLETEAYVQAVQRLTTGGDGGRDAPPGLVIPGLGLPSTARDVQMLTRFTRVETQHRDFIRGVLGRAAIRPFNYRFGIERMSRGQVLRLIYDLEQGGTSAYLGAIPFFATKNYVQLATAIQGTEARHTAILADIVNDATGALLQPTPPLNALRGQRERPLLPDQVLAIVSPFIIVPGSTR